MLVLGVTGGIETVFQQGVFLHTGIGHDTAAVLMQAGEVISGIEEERIIRIKHTNKIWSESILFCLKNAGKHIEDIDAIAFYASEESLNQILNTYRLSVPMLTQFVDIRHLYQFLFEREFNVLIPTEKFHFVHHHLAHAANSYYLSGFNQSLVLTIDGEGDDISSMVIDVKEKNFNILNTKSVADSLGHFYLKVIAFLGYKDFDEYKVMGLAPYGDASVYREQFNKFYDLLPDGDYCIHSNHILQLYEILQPRRQNEAFSQVHKDIAAALQESLESIVFHILCYYQKLTGHTRLVISGGVAQNSSMNGKILNSGLFEEVFVPSFAGDSGCAYGAAAYISHQMQPNLPFKKVSHAYWGTLINDGDVVDSLLAWDSFTIIEKMSKRSEQVSDLIINGAVIGWVQGRSEFGPRALGNRSIIADPRIASHKERINEMIKMRESYRPFAPSILEEKVCEFFEVPNKQSDFPFMSFVLNVKPKWQERLPAITHIDGTARLQTVSKIDNPRYWELIDTFGYKTGIPILLNTSFNNNAEPIVDSIDDAVVCYLTTGLNYLVVGDYLVRKKEWETSQLSKLFIRLPKAAVLHREDYYIDHNERGVGYFLTWNYDTTQRYHVSGNYYKILLEANGTKTLKQLMSDVEMSFEQHNLIFEETLVLWANRLIVLNPRPFVT